MNRIVTELTGLDLRKNALAWRKSLMVAHGVGWREHFEVAATMRDAVGALFKGGDFPVAYNADDLRYERDELGKPFVTWHGIVEEWAEANGWAEHALHISNTHDGGAHIVLAAYHPDLVGIGIDAVHLPRLMSAQKDASYLRRFAARFMSAQEQKGFGAASANDDVTRLRLRTAAHFSLMEAASKACGTGLKIGAGMGRATSLPKQSLGVEMLSFCTGGANLLLVEGEALARLDTLGAKRAEAYWSADEEFLVSVVFLWKNESLQNNTTLNAILTLDASL